MDLILPTFLSHPLTRVVWAWPPGICRRLREGIDMRIYLWNLSSFLLSHQHKTHSQVVWKGTRNNVVEALLRKMHFIWRFAESLHDVAKEDMASISCHYDNIAEGPGIGLMIFLVNGHNLIFAIGKLVLVFLSFFHWHLQVSAGEKLERHENILRSFFCSLFLLQVI